MSAAASSAKPILVWDFPTRVFHWSLAACFAIAYVTAESDAYALVHQTSGYLFAALIGFRASRAPVPVLILTARDASADIVAGLDSGADDYLVKP